MRAGRTLHWESCIAAGVITLGLLACGGCKAPPVESPAVDAGPGPARPGRELAEDTLSLPGAVFGSAGELDIHSRYPSTVVVRTYEPSMAGIHGRCSGVLIHPRLVLTAGHCVCTKRRSTEAGTASGFLVDGTACASSPIVTVVDYGPPLEEGIQVEPSSRSRSFKAMEVHPHPDFKVVLDEQGSVVSGRADLAVIVLSQPVEGSSPIGAIADSEVRSGELLTLVSYTYDELVGGMAGQRRFHRYRVVKEPSLDGRVLFEQPERQIFRGDSGGPCLRGGPGGDVLAGISSRGLGGAAAFTSVYAYRGWLQSEIEHVGVKR